MFTVYLVEDDKNLNLVLTSYLKNEGWNIISFSNGLDAKKNILNPPDLWILDIMLPDISGYELIKEIKTSTPDIPAIFISARDQDVDRLLGLELGSDDYLPKPFLPRELVIRAKNILNRNKKDLPEKISIDLSPYMINENSRTISFENKEIDLTTKEFDLLVYFSKNLNIALSREQILYAIWGHDYFGSDRVVDDLIRRVRKKLPKLDVETVYGYGYRVNKS